METDYTIKLQHVFLTLLSLLRKSGCIPILLFLAACEGDLNTDSTPEIVIEGSIAEGDFPVVFVTTTVPMNTNEGYTPLDSLEHHVLNWARVAINDGERTVVLTGRINHRYSIPCYFTTGEMRGEAGKTYHIDVTYGDYHATATTTIPKIRPTVDSLSVSRTESNENLISIEAHVSPQQAGGYYQFLVGAEERENDFFPSFLGLYTDQNIESGAILPIYRSHNRLEYSKETFLANFYPTEKVHIRFASIERQAYDFWNAFEKFVSMGNNLLFPTIENLPSNIHGGIGIWYGYSYSEYFIDLSEFLSLELIPIIPSVQ